MHSAAREFPQTGHRLAGRSLGDQDAAIGIDEGAGSDQDDLRAHSWAPGSDGV
jgi:hypothetical protein